MYGINKETLILFKVKKKSFSSVQYTKCFYFYSNFDYIFYADSHQICEAADLDLSSFTYCKNDIILTSHHSKLE
jgi:hypothetical protein